MNATVLRRVLVPFAAAVGLFAAVVALTSGAGAIPTPVSGFDVVLTSVTPDGDTNTTTYVWTLTGPAQDGLSHVLIDTCLGGTAVSSDATEGYEDPDGHGHTGYKWEAEEGDVPVGATFSITFPGLLDGSGAADTVWAKSGDHAFGTTAGPACGSTTTTTTSTTTTSSAPTSTTTTVGTTGVTPTTTGAVLGVTVRPAAPEQEAARALPEELAFTGVGDALYALTVLGAALLALGIALRRVGSR